MSKKDYTKFAELVRLNLKTITPQFLDGLCNIFEEDNPNFDRQRFVIACGGKE